ncbi:hypothetical protein P7K49_002534 [Saguinus oedipus]|uniref:Uncharacterized protein n=1 Tax=Saguinus oedipus TaxID=9490 RepID=A0ABQ9WK99_SAGOE|nr:hypothetical protein P7K49_002534 [Saguinus oedipus]
MPRLPHQATQLHHTPPSAPQLPRLHSPQSLQPLNAPPPSVDARSHGHWRKSGKGQALPWDPRARTELSEAPGDPRVRPPPIPTPREVRHPLPRPIPSRGHPCPSPPPVRCPSSWIGRWRSPTSAAADGDRRCSSIWGRGEKSKGLKDAELARVWGAGHAATPESALQRRSEPFRVQERGGLRAVPPMAPGSVPPPVRAREEGWGERRTGSPD